MSKRKSQLAAATEIADMLKSQAGSVTQDDIPPHLNVFATMEAGWKALEEEMMHSGLTRKQWQDARFLYYRGVQVAANLCIYCAGQMKFEAAADQITADVIAYEKEAEAILRERKFDGVVSEPGPRAEGTGDGPTEH